MFAHRGQDDETAVGIIAGGLPRDRRYPSRCVLGSIVYFLIIQAAFSQSESFFFDAVPSTADVVLKEIAEQSDTQILFPLDQVGSIRANGVHGTYSVREALELALEGTGLKATLLDSGAIAVIVDSAQDLPNTLRTEDGAVGDSTAHAAHPDVRSDDEVVERIVVIGSLIRREERSSQLVTRINKEEIRLTGVTNAVDLLTTVTQNISINVSSNTATSGGLTNLASLRALGPENTLVLYNGRRLIKNPLKHNGVDLNTVPIALLDAVDVLSDGASSIYGTDAVAGVVNFLSEDELQGIQYYAHMLQPNESDGELVAAALSIGIGSLDDDGWNFFAGGTWRERKKIVALDRDFSNTAVIPERGVDDLLRQAFPANLTQFDASGGVIINNANPFPDCDPPATLPSRGGCGLDASASGFIDLQNPEEQQSFVSRLTTQLGRQKASFEYLWAQSRIISSLAPTTFDGIQVPTTSPYFPGMGIVPDVPGLDPTLPIVIATRWTPGGRRSTENDTVTDRILGQVMGDLSGFDYEAWALHSTSNAKLSALDGAYLRTEFDAGFAGVNGVFLNPFGEQTVEAQEYLADIRVSGTLVNAEGTLTMAGITLGRDLLEFPAGPVSSAIAFEFGQEDVDYHRNELADMIRGGVVGGDQTVSGDRDRYSVTAEILIPITDRFEVNASIRYDDYSDFGTTTNPKILVNYDVADNINLHGSFNTGFRAPTLYNIFTPNTLSFIFGVLYDDPILCPDGIVDTAAGGVDIRDCNQLYNNLLGGNRALGPEESTAFTVGVDLRPTESMVFRIDYWNYELDEKIGPLSHAAIFADPVRFSSFQVRCSEADPNLAIESGTCSFGGGGDPIAYVVQTNANLGKTETSGMDLAANWSEETDIGLIGVDYRATYVDKYDFERVPGDPAFGRAGRYFDGFPVFRYRHVLALSLARNAWSGLLQNQFESGYTGCNAQCGIAEEYYDDVESYSLWNLTVTHKFNDALSVTAHIKNMFDEDPPFAVGASLCTGCDLRFVDTTGRAFGVSVQGSLEDLGIFF